MEVNWWWPPFVNISLSSTPQINNNFFFGIKIKFMAVEHSPADSIQFSYCRTIFSYFFLSQFFNSNLSLALSASCSDTLIGTHLGFCQVLSPRKNWHFIHMTTLTPFHSISIVLDLKFPNDQWTHLMKPQIAFNAMRCKKYLAFARQNHEKSI